MIYYKQNTLATYFHTCIRGYTHAGHDNARTVGVCVTRMASFGSTRITSNLVCPGLVAE